MRKINLALSPKIQIRGLYYIGSEQPGTYFCMFRHMYVIFFLIFKATITGITEKVENRFLSFLQTNNKKKQ